MEKNISKTTLYKYEIYKSIPINYLIIFGIYSITSREEKCTFERMVGECFTLFPKTFSLGRYSQWPDSLKFDRPLRMLREMGLITGNSKSLLFLTRFGEKIARDTEKALTKISPNKRMPNHRIRRDVEINLINSLKDSAVFHKFLNNRKRFLITMMELRNLLHCTLETPLRIVNQNLAYAKNIARELNEKPLIEFLEACKKILNKK